MGCRKPDGRRCSAFGLTALILTAFAASTTAVGEPTFATGDGAYDAGDIEGLPLAPLTRTFVPEAVDLSARFPPPGDQGKIGSCVSWAVGYAARSYYEAALTSAGDPTRVVSPASLHAELVTASNGTCAAPRTNIAKGLQMLRTRGAASIASHPVDPASFCTLSKTVASSQRFRVKDYWLVGRPTPRFGAADKRTGLSADTLDRAKQQLAAGHPVLLGMLVGKSLSRLSRGETYTGTIHERPDEAGDAVGHAVVVTGYDDRRRAIRIMNSWGNDWADDGFAWIDYRTVLTDGRSSFVMRTDREPIRPRPLQPGEPQPRPVGSNLPDAHCADVWVEGSTLAGFVSTEVDRARAEELARQQQLTSSVVLRPWPICETLLTLREPLQRSRGTSVSLVGGNRPLRIGETFAITITPPDVPSYLYVLYIEDDGTVVNLAPRGGPLRAQTAPGRPIIFGDGQAGRPTFRATPPKSTDAQGLPRSLGDPERGHEAVIAIAARAPIVELEDEERADSSIYRVAANPSQTAASGPPDRLLLSKLRDIVHRRVADDTIPREVSAAVLHIRIVD